MTTDTQSAQTTQYVVDPATRLGHVHYTVADLERQIAFYGEILGFKLHWREGKSAGLGAGGEDLLRLTQIDGARPAGRGYSGLYHTAFLVPTRWDLAQLLLRQIAGSRTPIQGTSNHGTHLAIYLPDAEGNGIELAWDFPQEQWPRSFDEMMRNNRGLDPQELIPALMDRPGEWPGLDPATTVGHVHLHVAHIAPTKAFYHDALGFNIPFDMSQAPGGIADTAMFFAAGDYHHHIGTNIWQGEGAPPPPENSTGLRYYSVVLPNADAMDRLRERVTLADIASEIQDGALVLRDPAGNGLHFTVETA